jgi:hypothetical protein
VSELGGIMIILISAYELEMEKIGELKASNCIAESITRPVSLKALLIKYRYYFFLKDAMHSDSILAATLAVMPLMS